MKLLKILKKNKGFTIIEILCIVAILGMLAAVSVPQFMFIRDSAKKAATVSNARSAVSTIIGLTALYDKDHWYSPRNSAAAYDYSEATMNNYLEALFEDGREGNNTHSFINQYSDSKVILNWSTSISGTGEDPAVFLTDNSNYSHANSTVSNMAQLQGTIIVYFATESSGSSQTTNHIEVYYTDEAGVKSAKPFIIVI